MYVPVKEVRHQPIAIGQESSPTSSTTKNLVIAALVGAVALLWWRARKTPAPARRHPRRGELAPGWYAIGYNVPEGVSGRKIEWVEGPFRERGRAASSRMFPLYKEVRYREIMP